MAGEELTVWGETGVKEAGFSGNGAGLGGGSGVVVQW